MRFKTMLVTTLLAVSIAAGATDERLMIGRFSAGDLQDWQSKSFKGETRYVFDDKSGQRALFADSRGAASGLYREIRVDLNRTPWLNW
ncbi:MAG TPA: DUF3047 domain-containing protein, partial [Xanthomonadaceae bacterium]|nr:DUF3047 domain-containing protein [Xanthomonadaceae bacterium]